MGRYRFRDDALRYVTQADTVNADGTITTGAHDVGHRHLFCRVCGRKIAPLNRVRYMPGFNADGYAHDECGFFTAAERARRAGGA